MLNLCYARHPIPPRTPLPALPRSPTYIHTTYSALSRYARSLREARCLYNLGYGPACPKDLKTSIPLEVSAAARSHVCSPFHPISHTFSSPTYIFLLAISVQSITSYLFFNITQDLSSSPIPHFPTTRTIPKVRRKSVSRRNTHWETLPKMGSTTNVLL